MNHWLWETFHELLNGPGFSISDSGPLLGPITKFRVERDDNRNIALHTLSRNYPRSGRSGELVGAIRPLTECVTLTSQFGFNATAKAVYPVADNATYDAHDGPQCWQRSYVGEIEICAQRPKPVAVTLDWLENVDRESCRWVGEVIRTKQSKTDTRTVGEGASAIVLKGRGGRDGHSNAALQMKIGGIALFVCAITGPSKQVRPGYILYNGAPDAEVRRRIREVVGFALGSGFVHLGSTALDKDSHLVWTTAVSGNPFGDRLFEHAAEPPAPLGQPIDGVVEQAMVDRIANALFDHYDELDFRSLSWAYWHAVCAPAHMAAGHFGAAIEAVQAAYLDARPEKKLGRIVQDKSLAKKMVKALSKTLEEFNLDQSTQEAVQNKIANINQPSGAAVSQRLMADLGLEMGPGEQAAWQRRNQAAHGKARRPEDSIPIARETELLRSLLNRLVLRIASASPTYIDRYTPGYRVRPLSQPVSSYTAAAPTSSPVEE